MKRIRLLRSFSCDRPRPEIPGGASRSRLTRRCGGSGGTSTRPDRQDAIDKIKDVTSKLTSGDGRGSGMDNPLLAALDKPRGGHDAPPDAEPRNIIDGRPGGREEGTGSVSQSESKGKHVKVSGTVTASTTDAGTCSGVRVRSGAIGSR